MGRAGELRSAARPFVVYRLCVPLGNGHVYAYRRYSEFVDLDQKARQTAEIIAEICQRGPPDPAPFFHAQLCRSLGACSSAPWLNIRELPPLPPRTAPWADATSTLLTRERWAKLQARPAREMTRRDTVMGDTP